MRNYQGNRPSFRERVARFMAGRNGADRLYHFTTALYFILFVANIFVQSYILTALEIILICYAFFRVLSRNIYKRQRENQAFIRIIDKPKEHFKLAKCKIRDRKTHVYKRCPSCKNNLRLPKQKGKHTALCPVCKAKFDVKI